MEKRHRRRKKKNNAVIYIITGVVIIALIVLVIFVSMKVYNFAFKSAKDYVNSSQEIEIQAESAHIEIPEGASTKDIAEILNNAGLIGNEFIFRLQSKLQGYDGTYIQGKYDIPIGSSAEEIMNILQNGPQVDESRRVTIPEGFTSNRIAELLDEKGIVTYDEFINEMNTGNFDYDFLKEIPKRDYYLEGYLFPATYDFANDATAHDVICQMLDRFQIAYDNILKNNSSNYTSDELVTVASMVEAEIQVPEERPIAAKVIYNRLDAGMKLQIDSTVQYANNTRNEVVTYNDLDVDSPYNTYIYEGLPIGPICNPGEAALEAAASPDDNNYIYYVLKERGSGEHFFTDNYDEFLAAKESYQNSFGN